MHAIRFLLQSLVLGVALVSWAHGQEQPADYLDDDFSDDELREPYNPRESHNQGGCPPCRPEECSSQSVCTCQLDKMVCGSSHTTFSSICALNEESIRRGRPDKYNPQLTIEYWGPCKEAPVIISPPSDSYGPLGANLTLDCEARGYPAPVITWQFVSVKGETISLPSDDQSVAIQMRGGPEPMMVTGWAQIMSLDPSYIGTYHCIATNDQGQVYAMASVGVYKNDL
eukprot:maker-scaffold687_size111633-snap-gene-0.24 protein:Tk07134 transcript:maker-scaffold687_size111633-snap-gene-0.24-mRNA-1 annotation:"insulin-like growth factor-binding protein 7 precursor"